MNGPVRSAGPVSAFCPHCGDKVVFALSNHVDDRARLATAATASCPSCSKNVQFWSVRHKTAPAGEDNNPAGVFMYPPAKLHFPIPNLGPDIPEQLHRSFLSAVEAFNSKNYAATAVCGRRTLEGIFKYLLPKEQQNANLARLIAAAKDHVDLAEPLTKLSHAIRDGGNLGAHFDAEREPDQKLARQMVELLSYLISYLYVLPNEIKKLEESLGKD